MAIITFWSSSKKQTGQTMSLAAIATSMAIEHNYKILIISTKYNDNSLELCFGGTDKNKKLVNRLISNPTVTVDSGIEGLSKMVYSGRMTPEIIQNYTKVIYKNRLEILYGYREATDRPSKDEYMKIRDKYKDVVQNASRFYDMVFVDLDKGLENDMIRQVLSISDVIVYNVEQKINMINEFVRLKNENDKKQTRNLIHNIGRYDSFSKYTIKNISRYVGIRRDITAIPYNTLFFEASSEENVADLFLKIRNVSDADRNAGFMKAVHDSVQKIIYKVQELQMMM